MNDWKIKFLSSILSMFLLSACNSQNQTNSINNQINISPQKNQETNFEKGVYRGIMDSNGVLWFASRGNGVHRYDGNSYINLSVNDGLCDNDISSIFEDREGNIWFGTPNGMCRYDQKEFTHVPIPYSDTTGILVRKWN